MKIMQKITLMLCSITALFYLIGFIPIKWAIKKEDIKDDRENYIVVQAEASTVSAWIYEKESEWRNVSLLNETIRKFNRELAGLGNQYICYGKFNGSTESIGIQVELFDVTGWDILYPIKRNKYMEGILPKSYLCIFDKAESLYYTLFWWKG
ncbi:hypothetical protein [Acetivibrio sp. MSJd-27]|uniref:hypothetical protein n=1 Tax=Acetivibrio sp. MSJd-27 TaxID=2841523 RepID=UPI0015AB39C8|nr:hypothetical protein [Acetivibrio sp. MSJd-27]MBU5450082.1 hypothetical protein [Acetivibrio sp. MSJd-27]